MNLVLSGFEPETSITADLLKLKKKSPVCSKDSCVQKIRRLTTEKYDVYDQDNAILPGFSLPVWNRLINVNLNLELLSRVLPRSQHSKNEF